MTRSNYTWNNPAIVGVTIEYDGPDGSRVQKTFPKDRDAKKFYMKVGREGKNPKVVKTAVS